MMNETLSSLTDPTPVAPAPEPAALPRARDAADRLALLAELSTILAWPAAERLAADLTRLFVPAVADLYWIEALQPDGSIAILAAGSADDRFQNGYAELHIQRQPRQPAAPGATPYAPSNRPGVYPTVAELHGAAADADAYAQALVSRGACAGAVAPLRANGEAFGALIFGTTNAERRLTRADEPFLSALANGIALMLDNQRLRRQTQEAVETRDATLAIVAHELRTPLAALTTQFQILRRRVNETKIFDERLIQGLTVLDNQTRRLHLLVETLLEVTHLHRQPRPFAHERFDLSQLALRVCNSIAATLTHHSLAVHLGDAPLPIIGDPLRIEQALQNLIQNAVKYSPNGGTITLSLERADEHAVITIVDEGIGIPSADRERIFERFYRAPNAISHGINGVGVGLYIVHVIITLHNGRIFVPEAAGAGATFVIELPLAKE
jgi:signal transduction histidine kinase